MAPCGVSWSVAFVTDHLSGQIFWKQIVLIDWCIFILLSRESDGALCFGRICTRLEADHFLSFPVDVLTFFPRKFAACSKPPSRDNYRKASYPRTQQRDQGAG